jgi:putative peptide zinc metalloprotease protein
VIAEHFFGFGLLLAVICMVIWLVVPVGKWIKYLTTDHTLIPVRSRAMWITFGGGAVLLLFLWLVPVPASFRAPGLLEADRYQQLFSSTGGRIKEVLAPSGSWVHQGQPLISLTNPELELEKDSIDAQLRQIELKKSQAFDEPGIELESISKEMEGVKQMYTHISSQLNGLVVKAPYDGYWVATQSGDVIGSWVDRGTMLGEVIDPSKFVFRAIVTQDSAHTLFSGDMRAASVRVAGETSYAVRVKKVTVVPYEQNVLPSPALGWSGGGDIEVAKDDPNGTKTVKPFFEVRAELENNPSVKCFQHQRGIIRFSLKPEPLLMQGLRKLSQVFQEKLKL